MLLKQVKFKADTFHPRGIPILMRGFRTIMQEEMLNAAQDAIADRLYTPLILAKLGASANDLGTQQPWIPTEDDRADFEEALDAAFAGDFRVLVHHFAIQMESVFGREAMPNLDGDFDRIMERELQVFGLSKTMLSGSNQGETYAADALNRDLISQLLTTYQRKIKKFYKDRALIVAEAQGHYDYEERNGKRYVIMEEVLEIDEETGEQRIVEQPKLLIPDMHIRAMNMSDEENFRQFVEALRASGVPISAKTRLVNVPIDLEEEVETLMQEQVDAAVAAQETRKKTYQALRDKGLPIPEDLKADFGPKALSEGGGGAEPLPSIGTQLPAPSEALTPPMSDPDQNQLSSEEVTEEDAAEGEMDDGAPGAVIPLPRSQQSQRPPESDEQRANMPKPAALGLPPAAAVRSHQGHETVPEGVGDDTPWGLRPPNTVGTRRTAGVHRGDEVREYGAHSG
jgi:hypothetical protein